MVSPDGTEHWFDPSLLTEAPATERPAMYSDRRVLRAPLPAIARGAVVEVETRQVLTPWARSGSNHRFALQNVYPTRKLTVRVELPRDLPFHVTETGAQWAYTTREDGGTRVLTLEVPPTPALEPDEPETPEDFPALPLLWVSTTPDWQSAASEYAGIVDQVLKTADLRELARKVIGDTRDPQVAANRILTWMAPLRYASVDLGDTSVVPGPPAEVLRRQFGDCKDLSTLVVGLLRAAGFEAWTAPLLTEFHHNIDAAPGLRPVRPPDTGFEPVASGSGG